MEENEKRAETVLCALFDDNLIEVQKFVGRDFQRLTDAE